MIQKTVLLAKSLVQSRLTMAIDDCELTELLKLLLLKVERAWLFEAGVKVSVLRALC